MLAGITPFGLACLLLLGSLLGSLVNAQSSPVGDPILTDPAGRDAVQLLEDAKSAFAANNFPQAAVLGYLALRQPGDDEAAELAMRAQIHHFLSTVMGVFQYRAMERIHAKAAWRAWEDSGGSVSGVEAGRYLLRLGIVIAHGGDFVVAEDYLQRALGNFERDDSDSAISRDAKITALLELARLSLARAGIASKLDRAGVDWLSKGGEYLEQAVELALSRHEESALLGPVAELQARMLLLGSSHLPDEHRETAERMLSQAATLLLQSLGRYSSGAETDPNGLIRVLNDLISVLRRSGRMVEATEVADRALQLTEQMQRGSPDLVANLALLAVDLHLGENLLTYCRILMGQEEARIDEFASKSSEALALAFSEHSRHRSAMCLSLLGETAAGDKAAARAMLELALRRKAVVTRSESIFWNTLYRLDADDMRNALDQLKELRAVLGAKIVTADFHGIWALVNSIEQGEEVLSVEPWWRQIKAPGNDSRERAVIEEYGRKILGGSSPWDALGSMDDTLESKPIELEQVAQALPRDAALVEFLRVGTFDRERELFTDSAHYWALVMHPDRRVKAIDLGDAAALENGIGAQLDAFRTTEVTDAERQNETMSALYGLVWAPLAGELKSVERLVLATDGVLALVPFAALVDPAGRYLVEYKTFYQVASGRELAESDAGAGVPGPPAVVFDPDFDAPTEPGENLARAVARPLGRLDATAKEGAAVEAVFPGEVTSLSGPVATETRLRNLQSPTVLHIATHGLFGGADSHADFSALGERDKVALHSAYVSHVRDLSRSGLALAGINSGRKQGSDDGLLTAFDVTAMNLAATRLVVLSGCDTGLGNPHVGEGVLGLRRAFRIAGAKYVVMSLWRLKDKEAERQMRYFYRHFVAGMDPVDALHRMQRERIAWFREALQGRAPPRLWGAWIIQGTPGSGESGE